MRTTELYQVWDRKAESVVGPILTANRPAPIVRYFHEVLADEKTDLGKHPEDYNLVHIGTQDTDTGTISGLYDDNGVVRIEVIATGEAWASSREVNR